MEMLKKLCYGKISLCKGKLNMSYNLLVLLLIMLVGLIIILTAGLEFSEVFTGIRGRDIVIPYVFNIVFATIIILAYAAIRYRKIGPLKVVGTVFGLLVLAQALFLSTLAITRLPINRATMPIVLTIFLATAVISMVRMERMNKVTGVAQEK